MTTFVLAFVLMLLVVAGMALGVVFAGRTIKGSCGGLNAIAEADHCVVCQREIDPESPLRGRLGCPRACPRAEDAPPMASDSVSATVPVSADRNAPGTMSTGQTVRPHRVVQR
jgi:hypothetical protein